jgi:putative nucleotidyltransferase with HDIG domain
MPVQIVGDNLSKLSRLRSMLEKCYEVRSTLLRDGLVSRGTIDAAVIAVDLGVEENIAFLKKLLPAIKSAQKRIFLIERKTHLFAVQAYALGATNVLSNNATQNELLAQLADSSRHSIVSRAAADDAKVAASAGASALASMFSSVLAGSQVDVAGAEATAGKIADSVEDDGLSAWLDTVRSHHEGTYQHCLLVTGVAVDFGLSLGLARSDIKRLYSAAMFHDIGKARIPLKVLDKPGQLDADERSLIETHPAAGWQVLRATAEVSAEVLDAVRHHHEYLDGSGYPDKLCAENITDVVRILTISDIFSALIEDRRYRPPMPREKAYEVICNMNGKLEKPLVKAFREVALNR